MDMHSLSHSKWECKYHVVFCTVIQKKGHIWSAETGYSKYFMYALQEKGRRDHRSGDVSRSCAYAGKDTIQHKLAV